MLPCEVDLEAGDVMPAEPRQTPWLLLLSKAKVTSYAQVCLLDSVSLSAALNRACNALVVSIAGIPEPVTARKDLGPPGITLHRVAVAMVMP